MKRVTKIAAVLVSAALMVLLPNANAFTAKAEEPVYYAVKFNSDKNEWRMQANTNVFDESKESRAIYYLQQDIKEGDIVVVYNDVDTNVALDLGSARLSNLTLTNNTNFCIIKSGGANECYVLGGSISSINGDVANAYVYDTATCTFTGNVETLTMYSASEKLTSSVSVGGTVEHLHALPLNPNIDITFYNLYRFKAGTLYVKEGILQTASWNYLSPGQYAEQVPAEPAEAPAEPTEAPAEPAEASAAPEPSDDSDEYDDVPKTGQDNIYMWFLCASALFFTGSYILRRSDR